MKSFLTICLTFLYLIVGAQVDPQWLRYSAISPDGNTIAFTYKGDLFTVPVEGGEAEQLTFHEAHDYKPVWSKDGKHIAFASNRYGNFDVYIMEAAGGNAKRLTFHSNDETPYDFTADGEHILFDAIRMDNVMHRQFPHRSQSELYKVPVDGGRVDQVFTFPAEYVSVHPNGSKILYHDKKGGENEWRKHHESSIARDIWVYDAATDSHTMLIDSPAEDRNPVFAEDGNTFYFLSEREGSFNVYKSSLDNPGQVTRMTDYSLHPVRFLSFGNATLCFGFDGHIYTMKDGESPRKVNITIRTQSVSNKDKFISINSGVSEMAVSPNGKEIAFIARGEVFVTSVEESFTKRLTTTPENERFVTWGPDGKSVVYSSERSGRWSIYKTEKVRDEEPFFFASTLLKETAVIENELDNYLPSYSPDGKLMAFVEGRRSIKVKEVETGNTYTLMTPDELFHMGDGDKYFTWSPDSKWLLIDWSITLSNSDILLMSFDGQKSVNLTKSGYQDGRPKWVSDGKQMLWFSNRDGLKSYATSGRTEEDVYAMFFDQDAWDKFNLSEEEYSLMKAVEAEKKKKDKEKKAKEEKSEEKPNDEKDAEAKKDTSVTDSLLQFEWDKMEEWKKRLTIHSSILGDAVLSKEGDKLYYLSQFEGRMNLWSTDLRTRETKMALKLNTGSGRLVWDKEMKNLFLLSGGRISKIDPEKGKNDPVKIDGEMIFDTEAERASIFDHVWLRTNAIFYHPDFHGIDWKLMRTEYEKYLPYIGNTFEMAEMLSEMLGELNVSHAGARYGGINVDNADATASLGIFMNYQHEGDGILIDEVIIGGPLDKADININAGMIIERINGELISSDQDVARYLNRIAGKFTLLEILDPSTGERQMVTVKPINLGEENRLLYSRWVKMNEKEVETKSGGQLGYVHIPGMSDGPFRNVYENMLGKYANTKGVIVDTRFNGGGDLVADLAMFFTGTPFISYETEAKVVGGEPTSRWTKPTLALINEAQYSDGHCFACGYTDLKIGTTVGMPVPGTCSFAGWERLPDGNVWGVVPVSAKDIDGDWMENNQTEPDIKIKNVPGEVDKGMDAQLNKAIETLLEQVNN